jgi:hypothetical protein
MTISTTLDPEIRHVEDALRLCKDCGLLGATAELAARLATLREAREKIIADTGSFYVSFVLDGMSLRSEWRWSEQKAKDVVKALKSKGIEATYDCMGERER